MASPVKGKLEGFFGLSHSEARILVGGLLCTDETGKVDCEKLAQKAGYKNGSSAGVVYRNAKRKLSQLNSSTEEEAPSTPAKATESPSKFVSTPNKGKAKSKKSSGGDSTTSVDGVDGEATPKSKRQKRTPAKSVVKTEDADNHDVFKSEPNTPDNTISQPFTPVNTKSEIKDEESESELSEVQDIGEAEKQILDDLEIDIDREFEEMEAKRADVDKTDGEAAV